jgi:hypothetical protein
MFPTYTRFKFEILFSTREMFQKLLLDSQEDVRRGMPSSKILVFSFILISVTQSTEVYWT